MTDELKRDAQLNEEHLEQAAGGAGTDNSCVPCKWDQYGRPTHWLDFTANKRFHYLCRDCGGLAYEASKGVLMCSRCGRFFIPDSAKKCYGYYPFV